MRKGTGILLAITAGVLGTAVVAWLSPNSVIGTRIRDTIFGKNRGFGDLFAVCGAPGQSCCKWPTFIPGLDPRYCGVGAGCDIATNTCVTPCGAGGQVCCDGPDTYAPQGDRSPTSPLYCANGDCVSRKQMCAAGACTRETRRCNELCGKAAGAGCCPPDAGIAVASCKVPGSRVCVRRAGPGIRHVREVRRPRSAGVPGKRLPCVRWRSHDGA